MTHRFNIQEQTFEVKEDIFKQLIIDPMFDPIEYNKYLNNYRLIRFNVKYTKELIKKNVKNVDDIQFVDFMLELRMSILSETTKDLLKIN